MACRIADYALIGDCQTAALVGVDGSIDWLCFPRFDSGACFAALLGTPDHGRWKIAPCGDGRETRRRYRDGTLVLETEFETRDGRVAVIDCMPPRTAAPDVVRIVEGRRGRVPMHFDLAIRFDYGSIVPWVNRTGHGIRATGGSDTVYCRSPLDLRGGTSAPSPTSTSRRATGSASRSPGRRPTRASRTPGRLSRRCARLRTGGASGRAGVSRRVPGGMPSSAP
jgi:GH15 family glucan-1,4-alpha-glucosidase